MCKPKLIKDWDELKEIKSETHYIEVDGDGYLEAFYIYKKGEDGNSSYGHYLYSHTFYGLNFVESTKLLQECGFNVILDNWDKEETREVLVEKSKDDRVNIILEELCVQYPNNKLVDEYPK